MIKALLSIPMCIATCYALFNLSFKAVAFFSATKTHPVYHIQDSKEVLKILLFDLLLVAVFVLQHSLMSSRVYKDLIGSRLGFLQRSIYTLLSCITLQFLFENWKTVCGWDIWFWDLRDSPVTSLFFSLVHTVAWCVLALEHALLEPFYLIGMKQVYYRLWGEVSPWQYMSRRLQSLITHMPHPGILCFLILLWVYPHMSLDRWLVSTLLTWYTCIGLGQVTNKDYIYTEEQSKESKDLEEES
ncbi:Nurim [Mizuhopecten yessoensis]|uniref:Nuclear envelope membrane protein n=1 Tax=Mizuhopecten yessoensis TaxID=6573 RepID=A0A210QP94_MIZYE|nr:Nurim [Mizuhopecten yessoensis]